MTPVTRRQLRHTACVSLFAWMFALLSGVANACLTQPNTLGKLVTISSPADLVVGGTAEPVTREVAHLQHPGVVKDDALGIQSAKEGCLKFCADESLAITKSRVPPADVPFHLFLARVQWRSATPVAAASEWPPIERPASVGPPLFIRLLRLTI